jgi:hypothetical protein
MYVDSCMDVVLELEWVLLVVTWWWTMYCPCDDGNLLTVGVFYVGEWNVDGFFTMVSLVPHWC